MGIIEGRDERLEYGRFFNVNAGDLVLAFLFAGESDSDAAGNDRAANS
jgi:hypothetical protein